MASTFSVNRREQKYIISKLEAEKLYNRLKKTLAGDPCVGYEPYIIRSLYFDSYFNMDFNDKVNGILVRKKIRIRIYNNDDSMIKLELKQKIGDNQEKTSILISRQLAMEMQQGNYKGLLEIDNEIAEQLYYTMKKELYRPKCVVEYERRAFADPTNDIRITLDTKINTNEGTLDLFAPRSCYIPADIQDKVILEVKYNRFMLSYIKDLLALTEVYDGAYSKYIAARKQLV